MTQSQAAVNELNGWNLDELQSTVEALQNNPEAGKLVWRGQVSWDAGFGMDAHTTGIEQLGQVMPRKFTLRGDHPPQLLGQNTGPTAVETLLASLGSCITGTYAAQATARGVKIESLEVEVEGSMDLNGFLLLQPIRAGMLGVDVRIKVTGDADDATLEEIRQATMKASPVYDSVANPVTVKTAVEKTK
ncbi:MAG: OsmC family protein [Chloroflexi bacterium]|nr:OsmC family protein [Chloroflexota bacterium]MDA1269659.1 OsmC family protein [Chloroflexota bacterium]